MQSSEQASWIIFIYNVWVGRQATGTSDPGSPHPTYSAGGTCSSQDVADSVDKKIWGTLANITRNYTQIDELLAPQYQHSCKLPLWSKFWQSMLSIHV